MIPKYFLFVAGEPHTDSGFNELNGFSGLLAGLNALFCHVPVIF
jgi:hypothetical protein